MSKREEEDRIATVAHEMIEMEEARKNRGAYFGSMLRSISFYLLVIGCSECAIHVAENIHKRVRTAHSHKSNRIQ